MPAAATRLRKELDLRAADRREAERRRFAVVRPQPVERAIGQPERQMLAQISLSDRLRAPDRRGSTPRRSASVCAMPRSAASCRRATIRRIRRVRAGRPRMPRRTAARSSPSTRRPDRSSSAPRRRLVREQRRVADEQRGVSGRQHRREIRRMRQERRRDLEAARAQHSRQHHRRPRGRVERDRSDVAQSAVRVNSATDATGPSDPMHTPGTTRSPGRSSSVIDGTMPRSMSPAASSARAH